MPSLHSLGGNKLEDEGTTIVCDALRESKVSKLRELNLQSNGIKVAGAKSVAAYLAVTAELTSVWSPAHEPSQYLLSLHVC